MNRLKSIGTWALPVLLTVIAVVWAVAAIGDILAAAVGALIPVLAKMTLVMAVDRDTTRISSRAQAAIDRARAVTRLLIDLGRQLGGGRSGQGREADGQGEGDQRAHGLADFRAGLGEIVAARLSVPDDQRRSRMRKVKAWSSFSPGSMRSAEISRQADSSKSGKRASPSGSASTSEM